MNESNRKRLKELSRSLLDSWETDPLIRGGLLITLTHLNSVEVEVRKAGKPEEFSAEQIRQAMLYGTEHKAQGWPCGSQGRGYALRYHDECLGVCLLFPTKPGEVPTSHTKALVTFATQLGPLFGVDTGAPLPLLSYIEMLPDEETPERTLSNKPHWERSQSRVEMPIREDLTDYIVIDRLPLF